jgi:aminoglycoside phosphotransferase
MRRVDEPQAVFAGHSGARITLHQRDGHAVVRKAAGAPEQSARLHGQREKQMQFHAAGTDTPRVLSWGEEQGLAFFEMDFVPGITIAAQICEGQVAESGQLAAFVSGWIAARQREVDGVVPPQALAQKLASVLIASSANRHAGSGDIGRLRRLTDSLRALRWPSLPRSLCHGDFTAENMLSGLDGRLILIDFDVSDISSYTLDIAKLYQDLLGRWCLRHLAIAEPNGLRYRNAQVALRRVRRDIDALLALVLPDLIPDLPALVCLNLMRAFPYSTDAAICRFILDRVEALLPSCRTLIPLPARIA